MNTGALYETVLKYGYLTFETMTSSSCDGVHVFDSGIELSFDSDSDDSDSHKDYNDPGLSGTTQEIRDVLNYSSNSDWI